MKGGQVIYRSVKMDDNTNRTALSVMDQIKLVLASFSNDTESELDVAEKLSADKLKKISALTMLFEKAISRARELGKDSVTLKVASEFIPYLDEVIDEDKGFGRYYDVQVLRKNLPLTIKHDIVVTIRTKKGDGKDEV